MIRATTIASLYLSSVSVLNGEQGHLRTPNIGCWDHRPEEELGIALAAQVLRELPEKAHSLIQRFAPSGADQMKFCIGTQPKRDSRRASGIEQP